MSLTINWLKWMKYLRKIDIEKAIYLVMQIVTSLIKDNMILILIQQIFSISAIGMSLNLLVKVIIVALMSKTKNSARILR